MSEPIFENTLLIVPLNCGMAATAANATIPAARAYSTKSWPWVSFQNRRTKASWCLLPTFQKAAAPEHNRALERKFCFWRFLSDGARISLGDRLELLSHLR